MVERKWQCWGGWKSQRGLQSLWRLRSHNPHLIALVPVHSPFSCMTATGKPVSSPKSPSCIWMQLTVLLHALLPARITYIKLLHCFFSTVVGWFFFSFLLLYCWGFFLSLRLFFEHHTNQLLAAAWHHHHPMINLQNLVFQWRLAVREEGDGKAQEVTQNSPPSTILAIRKDLHSCSQVWYRSNARKERFCRTTQVCCYS